MYKRQIYKRCIINKLQDPFFSEKEFLSEDKLFNYRYIKHTKKISIIPYIYYNYIQHKSDTITTTFREYKIIAAYNLCQYMLSIENDDKIKQLIRIDYLINLSACFQMLLKDSKISNKDKKRCV